MSRGKGKRTKIKKNVKNAVNASGGIPSLPQSKITEIVADLSRRANQPYQYGGKKFVEGPKMDSDDKKGHLVPVPVGLTHDGRVVAADAHGGMAPIGHVGGIPVYESADAPVGQWVSVPKGMTVVPGCYVDANGVMRFKENNAPAVWHHPSGCKYHQPPCKRRITDPRDIVYDGNNAPWCPDCIDWAAEDIEFKKREPKTEAIPISRRNGKSTQAFIDGLHANADYITGLSEIPGMGEIMYAIKSLTGIDVTQIDPEKAKILLREAVGEFVEVEELGDREAVTPEQQQKINAASHVVAPEIFRGGASKQKFYPSGQPRRW